MDVNPHTTRWDYENVQLSELQASCQDRMQAAEHSVLLGRTWHQLAGEGSQKKMDIGLFLMTFDLRIKPTVKG